MCRIIIVWGYCTHIPYKYHRYLCVFLCGRAKSSYRLSSYECAIISNCTVDHLFLLLLLLDSLISVVRRHLLLSLLLLQFTIFCVSTVRVGRALFVPSIDVITTFIYLIYLHICILLCWHVQWFVSVNVHKLLVILYICCLCDYVAFISMSGSGF